MILTVEDLDLSSAVHAGKLHAASLNQVKNNAVRQLLDFDIGDIGGSELAQVVALGALGSAATLAGEGAQDEKALRVKAHIASLPEQVVRELNIDVAHI